MSRKNRKNGNSVEMVTRESAQIAQVLLKAKVASASWFRGADIVPDKDRGFVLELAMDPKTGGTALPCKINGSKIPNRVLKVQVRLAPVPVSAETLASSA